MAQTALLVSEPQEDGTSRVRIVEFDGKWEIPMRVRVREGVKVGDTINFSATEPPSQGDGLAALHQAVFENYPDTYSEHPDFTVGTGKGFDEFVANCRLAGLIA